MIECQHQDEWFDRTFCLCGGDDEWPGVMHFVCVDCGAILNETERHQRYLDSIPAVLLKDTPEDRERLARVLATGHRSGAIGSPYGFEDIGVRAVREVAFIVDGLKAHG